MDFWTISVAPVSNKNVFHHGKEWFHAQSAYHERKILQTKLWGQNLGYVCYMIFNRIFLTYMISSLHGPHLFLKKSHLFVEGGHVSMGTLGTTSDQRQRICHFRFIRRFPCHLKYMIRISKTFQVPQNTVSTGQGSKSRCLVKELACQTHAECLPTPLLSFDSSGI